MLLKPPSKKLTDWLRRCKSRSAKRKERKAAQRDKRFVWQLVRVAVHQRDGGKCRRCSKKVYLSTPKLDQLLEVHHVVYRSAGGTDDPSNLLSLCLPCHDLIHRHMAELPERIQ